MGAPTDEFPRRPGDSPTMALTDTACKNAKCPPDKARIRLADSGGLYLEVVPTGGKLWRWKYRYAGKEKRLALGSYPVVALAQARRARDDARDQLKTGLDPVAAKKLAKAAKETALANNFEAVARAWFTHWKDTKTERHADYVLRRLEADVFPVIGPRPISDITAPELLAMVKKIEGRGAADIAKRAWQTCSQIFRYAIAHGRAQRNPAADVKPSDALKPRNKTHYGGLLEIQGTKETAVIGTLIERYPNKPGIKQRTLEEKFSEAKRILNAS